MRAIVAAPTPLITDGTPHRGAPSRLMPHQAVASAALRCVVLIAAAMALILSLLPVAIGSVATQAAAVV